MRKIRGEVGGDFYENLTEYVEQRRRGLNHNVARWARKKWSRKTRSVTVTERNAEDEPERWEIDKTGKRKRRKLANAGEHGVDKSATAVGVPVAIAGAVVGGTALGAIGIVLAGIPVVLLGIAGISAGRSKRRERVTKTDIKEIVRRVPRVKDLYTKDGDALAAGRGISHHIRQWLMDDENFARAYEYVTDNGFRDYENAKGKFMDALSRCHKFWVQNSGRLKAGRDWEEFAKLYAESIYRWERYTTYAVLIQEVMDKQSAIITDEFCVTSRYLENLLGAGESIADVMNNLATEDESSSYSASDPMSSSYSGSLLDPFSS